MRLKWYISTFIITLTLLGTLCKEQTVVPNQEIVLQFIDSNIESKDSQSTIEVVKSRLLYLGADNIQVSEVADNGMLKITYYSDADILSVKEIMSSENKIELGFISVENDNNQSEFPSDKHTKAYNLDVYQIQDSNSSESGFDGKLAIEIKSETDRLCNPVVDNFAVEIEDRKRDQIIKVAYKLNRNIALAIDNSSHNIPEVRAGPITI